jgi:hypothetical protein
MHCVFLVEFKATLGIVFGTPAYYIVLSD